MNRVAIPTALALAAFLSATSEAAEREWFAPQRVATSVDIVIPTQAMDQAGRAQVLFPAGSQPTRTTGRHPGSAFGPLSAVDWVGAGNNGGIHAAYDGEGRLVIVYQDGPIRWQTRDPSGALVSSGVVAEANEIYRRMSLSRGENGRLLLAWTESSGSACCWPLRYAEAVDGRFRAARMLTDQPGDGFVDTAVADSGAAIIGWSGPGGYYVATRDPGASGFGAPQRLEGALTGRGSTPTVGVADSGHAAIAVVTQQTPSGSYEPTYRVDVSVRSPGAAFPPVTQLSSPGMRGIAPDVAVSSSGEAIVAWAEWANFQSPCCADLRVAVRPPDGQFDAAQTLARDVTRGRIWVEPDGTGSTLLVWPATDGSVWQVRAARRQPGADFGPPENLSSLIPLTSFGYSDPFPSMGGAGNAFVGWYTPDNAYDVAVFDVDPPEISRFRAVRTRATRPGVLLRWDASEEIRTVIEIRRRGRVLRKRRQRSYAGPNERPFPAQRFPKGRYSAVISGTDRAGHPAAPQRVRFRVK